MVTREEDAVEHLLVSDTHDTLLFFTNRGRVTTLRCFDLPAEASRTARGIPVANLFQGSALAPNERVTTVMATSDLSEHDYLAFATRKGEVKRTPLRNFTSVRSTGKKAMDLEEGDDLVSVVLARADDEMFLVTELGKALRFSLASLTPRSATAGGVRGIRLAPNDNVIGAAVVDEEKYLLVVASKGSGKMTRTTDYMAHGRGTAGQLTFKVNLPRTGPLVGMAVVRTDEEMMFITTGGIVIRTTLSEVRARGRRTGGVRVMNLDEKDEIAAIASFPEPDKSEPAAPAPQLNGRANSRANGSAPAQPQPKPRQTQTAKRKQTPKPKTPSNSQKTQTKTQPWKRI